MSNIAIPAEIDFANLNVLTIDDAPFMLKMIERSLGMAGISKILTAKNGVEALDVIANNEDIDLIICDLEMPEMDGFEFVRTLRFNTNEVCAKIPVIILTGNGQMQNFHDSIDLGISGFVEKPITIEILKQQIINALTTPFISPPVI